MPLNPSPPAAMGDKFIIEDKLQAAANPGSEARVGQEPIFPSSYSSYSGGAVKSDFWRVQGSYISSFMVRGSNLTFVIVEGGKSDFFEEKSRVSHSWLNLRVATGSRRQSTG
jgi:hypothetical protein